MKPAAHTSEKRDTLIAALLWYGTWCACALIACGMVLGLRAQPAHPSVTAYRFEEAGIALLILLPVARVALMLITFLRERNYRYVIISATVLAIITAGVVVGLRR